MALTGYPVEDLALRASFVEASVGGAARPGRAAGRPRASAGSRSWSATWTAAPAWPPRVGLPAGAPQDAAALLHGGQVAVTSAKHHLPNYGVFDEFRYFVPGDTLPVFRLPAAGGEPVDVAIAICEDLWQDGGPVAVAPAGQGRAAGGAQRLALRAGQGRRPAGAVPAPRRGGGRARWPTPTRSAARTSWSSTATRSSSDADGRAAGPRPAVRGGAGRRRPRRCRPPTRRCAPGREAADAAGRHDHDDPPRRARRRARAAPRDR